MRWFELFEGIAESLRGIERDVHRIAQALDQPTPPPARGFHFTVGPTVAKETTPMALSVTSTTAEKILIKAVPDGPLDGPVTASVTTGSGTVESVDDTSFYVVSPDVEGGTDYSVSAVSAGQTLQDTISYAATAAPLPPATTLGLTSEAPVPKAPGAVHK